MAQGLAAFEQLHVEVGDADRPGDVLLTQPEHLLPRRLDRVALVARPVDLEEIDVVDVEAA